jgi:S1-C subfamily serine protease
MKRIKVLALLLPLLLLTIWLAGAPESSANEVHAAAGTTTHNWAQTSSVALTGNERQQLALRTVQIVMLQDTSDGLMIIGAGSGTLISADGLILTNAHVASPITVGGSSADEPDVLGIALLASEDEPPVPTYLASVVAVDGFLDLAVLRIDQNLDGSPIRPNDLDLPHVTLGNSDEIHLGDNLYIFGFPGIGGDTITFTRGTVAGFSSQDEIGNRAWIKTDATIAGGNSGGLAVNDDGTIVGIPTRASSGTNGQIADCRVVQDTNNDGRLDDNDSCIPIGGFINALRPVNLAVALIRAAQAGTGYGSPYPTLGGVSSANSRQQLTFQGWSESADSSGCLDEPVASFASGTEKVSAIFRYSGMTDGETVGYAWFIDDDLAVDGEFDWDGGASGDCFPFWLENGGDPLPDGDYTLLVGAGPNLPVIAQAETRIGGVPVATATLQMSGTVTDAETGKTIADAIVIVLNPGVLVDDWLDDPTLDDVFTYAETDRRGEYVMPDKLERDVRYEAAVLADGYLDETGFLEFSAEDADDTVINIALSK